MPGPLTGRLAARGPNGAAACAHPLATRTAMDVLRSGGNAVDAAVAAGAVMCVVEPHTSQLGGDAFMLVRSGSDGRIHAINASGPAPGAARADSFRDAIPIRGFRSTTVPGILAGWELAVRLFGTMPFGELLHDAIGYAANGAPVSRHLAAAVEAHRPVIEGFESTKAVLMPHGRAPRVGEILIQPELADSLRLLAIGGPDDFYKRSLAERLSAFMAAKGGDISLDDLWEYVPALLEPLSAEWRGYKVHVQPPVSQAHVMLEALLVTEPLVDPSSGPQDPAWLHACVEAIKLAFADRFAYSGDPSVVEDVTDKLLAPQFVAQRRACIDPERARQHTAGALPDTDTTQLAVADSRGNAITLIQSLFHGFGCGVMVEGTGILLNNRLTGFELDPTHPNALEPGKRPMHTLCTYFATRDGEIALLGGSPGGMRQVQTNLQTCASVLGFGDDPQTAVERPRWAIGDGLELFMEDEFGGAMACLASLGHDVKPQPRLGVGGCAQLIAREGPVYAAGSDPRGDGHAEAF